jgi:hypothetical protein
MPEKPSIFVSSTIFDFKDLRSAIRYYLSSLGYDVFLSEFNDFPKPLDQNAFDAGLETLRSSDLFILLIGSRAGSLYDEQQGITITRKEYQTAYELAIKGEIRLALFVRDQIWSVKNDRQALRDYLEQDDIQMNEYNEAEVDKLFKQRSPVANEPELIFDFINEVTRAEETRAAVREGGKLPIANWVHRFSTFQDIIDVLRIHLRIGSALSTIAIKSNIKREILDNLTLITGKYKGNINPNFMWASNAREHLKGGISDVSQMPGRYLRWILIYTIYLVQGSNMSSRFIEHGLRSGEFLEFDKDSGSYYYGLLNERLYQLRNRIERYRSCVETFREELNNLHNKYFELSKTEDDIQVPNRDLVYPLVLANIEEDIHSLSTALLKALDGDDKLLDKIKLNPSTPLTPEVDRIREESATREEITDWILAQLRDI